MAAETANLCFALDRLGAVWALFHRATGSRSEHCLVINGYKVFRGTICTGVELIRKPPKRIDEARQKEEEPEDYFHHEMTGRFLFGNADVIAILTELSTLEIREIVTTKALTKRFDETHIYVLSVPFEISNRFLKESRSFV